MSKSKCLGRLKIEPLTEFLENLLLKKSPIEYFWNTLIWLLTIVFINMFFKSLCIEKAYHIIYIDMVSRQCVHTHDFLDHYVL